ncbi:MAG: Lrp/AsnC family transcriptional regulator [Thermoanaerobaculales bacterium]|nr:Lrp/AsnC family transcriptional regulator [Thermoanaerobaculales bacterium]
MDDFPELDRIDFDILGLLQKNARTTNKDLAQRVGIAPSTCLERVRRLVDSGAIRGFHADIDPVALGVGLQAIIAVRLSQHMRKMVDGFHDHLMNLTEVRGVFHITGSDDYLVHVAVKDSDHLRDLALDSFTTRPEVDHIHTRLIFEFTPTWRLPILAE